MFDPKPGRIRSRSAFECRGLGGGGRQPLALQHRREDAQHDGHDDRSRKMDCDVIGSPTSRTMAAYHHDTNHDVGHDGRPDSDRATNQRRPQLAPLVGWGAVRGTGGCDCVANRKPHRSTCEQGHDNGDERQCPAPLPRSRRFGLRGRHRLSLPCGWCRGSSVWIVHSSILFVGLRERNSGNPPITPGACVDQASHPLQNVRAMNGRTSS